MTLTIELRDEDVTALAAKAQAHGGSAEQDAQLVLKRELEEQHGHRISAKIRELWRDVPREEVTGYRGRQGVRSQESEARRRNRLTEKAVTSDREPWLTPVVSTLQN